MSTKLSLKTNVFNLLAKNKGSWVKAEKLRKIYENYPKAIYKLRQSKIRIYTSRDKEGNYFFRLK